MTKKVKPNLTSLLAYLVETQAECNQNQAKTNELLATLISNTPAQDGTHQSVGIDVDNLANDLLERMAEKAQIMSSYASQITAHKHNAEEMEEIVKQLGQGAVSLSSYNYNVTINPNKITTIKVPDHLVGKVALIYSRDKYRVRQHIVGTPTILKESVEIKNFEYYTENKAITFIVFNKDEHVSTLEVISEVGFIGGTEPD